MDREKVISKLEKEVQRTYSTKTTVFQNGKKVSEEINTHREPCVRIPIEMADKILALLKEQEAVEPELEGGGSTWWYVCGECHGAIDNWDNYCKHCGRRIKHEKTE